MNTRKKQDSGVLAVMDAVEALESIVDLEFEREVELATQEEIQMQNHEVMLRTAKWTGGEDANKTAELIKQTFHVILHYLKNFYNHEPKQANELETAEGAKTIMVLVGEAAQKLDKYTTIFNETKTKNVKSSKEYKQLQEFYLTRIARKIDDSILGKWIFELSQGAMTRWAEQEKVEERKPISTKYVFIDLESVKKDTEYELFFLRKEDGTRFFNPRLIRNIKLVCDFGETIQKEKTSDPLTDIKVWQDHAFHIASKEILHSLGNALNNHFSKTVGYAKRELVGELNKALFALLLCSNPKNLQRNMPAKTCSEYFMDFHCFLRKALSCREYQQLIAYAPKQSETISHATLDLIQILCRGLFTGIRGYQELIPVFEKVFIESQESQSSEHEKAAKDSHMLWSSLAAHYAALKKLSKQHPNGPLEKVLEILEVGNYHVFDPITQSNTPFQLYSLYLDAQKMTNIRIPSPTAQEFIQKASILEEFKSFLRTYSKGEIEKKHLLFNLQDRTSWKDHARSISIEELQSNPQTQNALVVVTLSKDTEFYNQAAPYHQDNHAQVFIKHFKENISEESCGFYFPAPLKKQLFSGFIEHLIKAVHKVFFGDMNVLTLNNRRDFIEIFYLFLQLKIIEMAKSDTFSFTCKDGIDVGGIASVQLYAFLKILQTDTLDKKDIEHIDYMLYAAPLLIRERIILQERFERMINAIKRVETTKEELGALAFKNAILQEFGALFSTKILTETTLTPNL